MTDEEIAKHLKAQGFTPSMIEAAIKIYRTLEPLTQDKRLFTLAALRQMCKPKLTVVRDETPD